MKKRIVQVVIASAGVLALSVGSPSTLEGISVDLNNETNESSVEVEDLNEDVTIKLNDMTLETSSLYSDVKETETSSKMTEANEVEEVIEEVEEIEETEYKGWTTNRLNVRQSPNTKSKVLKVLSFNKEITYTITDNKEWFKVKIGDTYGYVNSKYISDKKIIVPDITCWKSHTYKQFKRAGRVRYGGHTYTWYSQRVLPGGGLKIPGRHVNDNGLVCDKDGYVVIACDFLSKGTVVNTPLGIKGKVYDCGAGANNLDIYVAW